jgi:hypothetical protein
MRARGGGGAQSHHGSPNPHAGGVAQIAKATTDSHPECQS